MGHGEVEVDPRDSELALVRCRIGVHRRFLQAAQPGLTTRSQKQVMDKQVAGRKLPLLAICTLSAPLVS